MKAWTLRIFLVSMGLLLAGYASLAPLLGIIGARTTGTITAVRRQGGERNEMARNRYDYGVGYHFATSYGQIIHGSATLVGTSYQAPCLTGPVAIRYLEAFPRLHLLERLTRFSVGNVILIGVGLLLISLARSPFRQHPRGHRRGSRL
ncbi:MAG: hypothetical protein Q8O00_00295 [Holophaga sp.]|nr:hypothetical protein [Holophaga sp.]